MELRGVLLSIVPLWGLLAHITNSLNFIRIDIVCRTIIPASIVLRAFHFRFIFPSSRAVNDVDVFDVTGLPLTYDPVTGE